VGLDGVELVLATEEMFQIAIPDEDAERMVTPRQVVEYVLSRVGQAEESVCLEQRAFYRLRRASMRLFQTARSAVNPSTAWDAILPSRARRHNWRLLHQATGTPQWPPLTMWGRLPAEVASVGGTARYLATNAKAALKEGTGWTCEQVEDAFAKLVKDQLGIKEFDWDQHFANDLGMDS
jgi:acyl carrier protein